MPNNCLDKNLHNNSGTSQVQRALKALTADYALVDERSTEDLLLFAKKYGAYLNFYDTGNTVMGDWSAFMAKDISVIIAALREWRGRDYITYTNNLYDNIKIAATNGDEQTNFKYIFDFVFSIVNSLNKVLSQLPADEDYAKFLATSITSKLSVPVNQLSLYYPFFLTNVLSGASIPTTDPLSPFDDTVSIPLNAVAFQAMFSFLNNNVWILPANIIIPPVTMFAGDSLKDIATNNFFTGAVLFFINGVISIINQAALYFENTISNYPNHTPHYAVYLSFIRLFKFAQDHLNNYTNRHLNFYYKKVLQLKNNFGLPDAVHLVFTLQKSIIQHLLSNGTLFKAGKDANNNNLFYSLTDDIVVNQVSVQSLKSLYLVKNYNGNISQQLFASPKADSADGQGAKVTSTDKSWFPFGDFSNDDFKSKGTAEVGFAIASNILFLNEGARTITITFSCDPFPNLGILPNIFSAKFTGNKKWFDASDYSLDPNNQTPNNNVEVNAATNQLVITITLNGNAPPIVPYSKKIHSGSFIQTLPMVQLTLENFNYYSKIKLLKITKIDINVDVDGVKNVTLQNDAGVIDSSKPFKPFGDFPDDGAGFIIGSKEIFQKQLSDLKINFIWQTSPDLSITNNIQAIALTAGEWNTGSVLSPNVNSDLTSIDIAVLSPPANNVPQSVPDFTANDNYSVNSIDGFIKLLLSSLPSNYYSLSTYLSSIASAKTKVAANVVSTSETDYTVTSPSPPPAQHVIIAQSMSIHYSAKETIDLTSADADDFVKRTDFFYHVEPFGFREMHPYLLTIPGTIDTSRRDNVLHVLPVFDLENDSQDSSDTGRISGHNNEGELWIGLSDTKPGGAQSILFQASEGSSNPLKSVTSINWFYMSSNNWILLDPATNVNDQTNVLSESGLVIFNLPGDETTNNTRADNNLLWIKAVVKNNTDAICKIISVQANAARAQFVLNPANKIYFAANIAAGTTSKPAISDAALKQTSQPYSSFGGVPEESNQQFNQRVSERLRHKHRAVTAWDYERLILQNFPLIHKVKCLNHTSLKPTTQDYSEMKPGDVMIVTVPDLSLVTGANPLLPFTNVGLLDDIKKFVKPLCSPFVHVHVCNPQFEAVAFNFNVYFINNNSNSSYYTTQLNTDVQKFLMPWAFGSSASDIEFGGKIEKSVVLNFVQSLHYVDFVTCFEMLKYIYQEDGTYLLANSDADEAVASTARSILVPYYNNQISPTANCKCNE